MFMHKEVSVVKPQGKRLLGMLKRPADYTQMDLEWQV